MSWSDWFHARRRRKYSALEHELRVLIDKMSESVPAKRFEAIERDLVDLRDLHEELHRSHARLRSRQGMREARARGANGYGGGDEPTLEELERKHGLRK